MDGTDVERFYRYREFYGAVVLWTWPIPAEGGQSALTAPIRGP